MFANTRVLFISLLVAFLALSGCQTPPKGLTPAQVAVLKQQGFELTDEEVAQIVRLNRSTGRRGPDPLTFYAGTELEDAK